jgi:hypothetical protein
VIDTNPDRPTMKDEKHRQERQTAPPANHPEKDRDGDSSKKSKQDRLKLALRANLKRRKSQARARGDLASASSNPDEVSPYDDSEKT